jgi:hypothetical protein
MFWRMDAVDRHGFSEVNIINFCNRKTELLTQEYACNGLE